MAVALACLATPVVARADPQTCTARLEAVKTAMRADPLRQTEIALFDAVAADCTDTPGNSLSGAWYRLGNDLIYHGLFDGAELAIERREALTREAGGRPEYELRSKIAIMRQDWPRADALLVGAYQFYADRPEVRSGHRSDLLLRRAQIRLQMGDTATARALAEEALAVGEDANGLRHASLWEPVALIGDAWAAEGDMDRAIARYQDALGYFQSGTQSTPAGLHGRLASAYLGAGRLADAEAEARLAIRYGVYAFNTDADRRRYRQTLAAILAAQGRGEEMMAELAAASGSVLEAVALDGRPEDLSGMANVLWQAREYRLAAFYFDQAYAGYAQDLPFGAPNRVTVAINAAQAHLFAGSVHFAVDRYRRAADEVAVLGRPPARQKDFRRNQVLALWAAAHWTAD
ncbi:MAG: hypothetical protein V4707_13700 [Pseudomonadota bacterium]